MKLVTGLLVGLVLAGLASAEGLAPNCSLVPGWTQDGPARTFAADNLFEYMDGNAEGYLLYQFQRMNGVNCKSTSGNVVVFDVSEMADAEFAYGMFMANRDAKSAVEKLGMAGQVTSRKAMLAKDKYYIEAGSNTPDAGALRAFVTAMANQVKGQTLPEAVGWFPAKGLEAGSVRLVPESLLGMRILKRGYVGLYDVGKAVILHENGRGGRAGDGEAGAGSGGPGGQAGRRRSRLPTSIWAACSSSARAPTSPAWPTPNSRPTRRGWPPSWPGTSNSGIWIELARAPHALRGQAGQQFPDAPAQHRVSEFGLELGQRLQNESPLRHPRMRDR